MLISHAHFYEKMELSINKPDLLYSGRYKINLNKCIECSLKRPVREYESSIVSFERT